MPPNTRGRKSTNAGSEAKSKPKPRPRPKGKGKGSVQATEQPSATTIAANDIGTFSFTMKLPVPEAPATPPRRVLVPEADTTPTRMRGGPKGEEFPALELDPLPQTSSKPTGPPGHEESVRMRLNGISKRVDAAGNNFKDISTSTPYDNHSSAPTIKGQPARLEGLSLAKSIGYAPTSDTNFVYNHEFAGSLAAEDITKWLDSKASDKVYGQKWKNKKTKVFGEKYPAVWNLPGVAKEEKALYAPYLKILTAIVDHFVKPALEPGIKRTVVDTHKSSLSHKQSSTRTSPDFVVRATGSCFEVPPDGREDGYTNTVTFFDAKLDGQMDPTANLKQASVYSRQIFAQQPNRIFVRCLFFSERRAQLIQFDRAGGQYTPFIDINAQPDVFVRMVVELCGRGSERQMGFDDSFHWDIVDGRKSKGYVTFGHPGGEKIYDLVDPHPISHSFDIRGCATTVWDVEERGTGARFIVKDSWAPDGRTPEHELLEIIKDVKGIGKMVDFYIRDFKASDFRCESTFGLFTDRQALRVLTEPHGRRIETFIGTVELLYAVYDVLIGHFEVYGLKILHRNITDSTVFLGCEGAKVGMRGILTGFEEALNFDPVTGDNVVSTEARLGTRFFQSCIILSFLTQLSVGEAPPHDHTDDLESVFNLMCRLFFGRHPNGKERGKKDKARNIIRGWDSDTPEEALAFKSLLFNSPAGYKVAAIEIVTASWGPACGALFKAFLEWVWDIQQQKGAILQKYREEQWEMKRREAVKQQEEMEGRRKGKKQAEEKEGESDLDETDEEVGKQSLAGKEDVGAESDLDGTEDEAGEQGGFGDQVQELAGATTDIHMAEDDDNPFLDEDGVEELLDVVDPALPIPNEVTFKKGLFAPLMENGMARKHYDTVINFFIMAITKIEMSPDQDGPPPVGPDRPPKRKLEHGFNEEVQKKLRRDPEPTT